MKDEENRQVASFSYGVKAKHTSSLADIASTLAVSQEEMLTDLVDKYVLSQETSSNQRRTQNPNQRQDNIQDLEEREAGAHPNYPQIPPMSSNIPPPIASPC